MCSIIHRFFKGRFTENLMQANRPIGLIDIIILCDLLLLGVALMLFSLPAVTWASEQSDTASYEKLDSRLLPWMGSWRLVSNKVNSSESELVKDFLLTISPGSNENSITMKGYRDETPLAEEVIIVDGLRHQLTDDKCTGWYLYSWSENGKRLLLNSEPTCPGDPPRVISGMSIIDEKGDWLDIQLLRNGEQKVINIRKYRNVDNESVTLSAIKLNRINSSRSAAGENFSINEIIELSGKVESEVLETALLEMGKSFPINSKNLIYMADAKVPSRVIDLMVALSFPDKFIVEGETISLAQEDYRQGYGYFHMPYRYCSYAHSFYPWHWASSTCVPCGYSYLGWYGRYDIYYPFWTPPYYTGGGGGDREINNGRLIGGRGYTSKSSESSSRRARPRYAPAAQRSRSSTTKSSSSSSSSSSSESSNSSESVTSSVPPSASPSGYSRGSRQ